MNVIYNTLNGQTKIKPAFSKAYTVKQKFPGSIFIKVRVLVKKTMDSIFVKNKFESIFSKKVVDLQKNPCYENSKIYEYNKIYCIFSENCYMCIYDSF